MHLTNLVLDGNDCFFNEDITITGDIKIWNGTLEVNGNLKIKGNVSVETGTILVSDTLTFGSNTYVNITNGTISCGSLFCFSNINMSYGDIFVTQSLLAKDIMSNGNIEVGHNAVVNNVTALNYLITGFNDSRSVKAMRDIYILRDNDSSELSAKELFVGGDCDVNNNSICAKYFEYGGDLLNCSRLLVEKHSNL